MSDKTPLEIEIEAIRATIPVLLDAAQQFRAAIAELAERSNRLARELETRIAEDALAARLMEEDLAIRREAERLNRLDATSVPTTPNRAMRRTSRSRRHN